jgi:hypothetical protein
VAQGNDARRYRLEADYAEAKMKLAIGDERAAWRKIVEAYRTLAELASRPTTQAKRDE